MTFALLRLAHIFEAETRAFARARVLTAARAARPGRAAVKTVALDDENCRPYFTNEAIIISIQTQDSICVNLGLYMINKIIGFHWELAVSVFRDPIICTDGKSAK